jgi:predicted porin
VTNSDRNDLYNTVGLAVVYNFNEWASVRAFVSYENRNSSDDSVADYNKLDAGGGLTFMARF